MGSTGLWMLPATALAMLGTGLPAWLVLVGTASLFALGGLATGAIGLPLLQALPLRLLGLLEHDLLQALPLYVLVGAMLHHLPLVDTLFRVVLRLLHRSAAAPHMAGMALGALLAPMNGSVGASISMLARAVAQRLHQQGLAPERSAALVCSASTLGVVVPPSLVLILLGDAMMRAHTEAVNATGHAMRIVNTQDIFHGALRPAAALLLLFGAISWWCNRKPLAPTSAMPPAPLQRGDIATAAASVACIVALLGGVTLGYLVAVEAAASGGLALLLYGALSGSLTRPRIRAILQDSLATTGALFALLVAATSFTLVLRAWGTDVWMADFLHQLPGGASTALACTLGLLVLCSFVLDAFEIIFVVVPIALPPLLAWVPDATWVAVLVLLVLQIGFLLPPCGYAILMVGHVLPQRLALRPLSRALAPYLLAQVAVLAAVLLWPGLVWHSPDAGSAAPSAPALPSDADIEQLLEQQRQALDKDTQP
jgi:tripartite ATP-independent transporter DctM subunit